MTRLLFLYAAFAAAGVFLIKPLCDFADRHDKSGSLPVWLAAHAAAGVSLVWVLLVAVPVTWGQHLISKIMNYAYR